jgi:hypothetical protein
MQNLRNLDAESALRIYRICVTESASLVNAESAFRIPESVFDIWSRKKKLPDLAVWCLLHTIYVCAYSVWLCRKLFVMLALHKKQIMIHQMPFGDRTQIVSPANADNAATFMQIL